MLGEIAARSGDPAPLQEARRRAGTGPNSARAAWTMVAWALEAEGATPPSVRPTVELIARLSDRPSADRDTTFLYRLAASGVGSTRTMLENLTKGSRLSDVTAIRAALYLLRDHGREDMREQLVRVARSRAREAFRGFAAAALFDAGDLATSVDLADGLTSSKQLPTMTWSALVQEGAAAKPNSGRLVSEPAFRRVQLGWVE